MNIILDRINIGDCQSSSFMNIGNAKHSETGNTYVIHRQTDYYDPQYCGEWKHSKEGKKYFVVGLGKDAKTGEIYIIYQTIGIIYQKWACPFELFFGKIEVDGVKKPIFEKVK